MNNLSTGNYANLNTFADRLKALIKGQDLTQDDIKAAAGVSQATVHRWLIGESVPSATEFARIAERIGISVQQLWDIVNGHEAPRWPMLSDRPAQYEIDDVLEELRKAHVAIADAHRKVISWGKQRSESKPPKGVVIGPEMERVFDAAERASKRAHGRGPKGEGQ